ncbi:uncharacterized protein LACBIDRAFT_334513 [Laccaria bicolor S238N-H82]|uniref:Predicted protein n=1 Tax=Laccaria bicolor (strain S238N-H82 / ATCC MYA-4686) TaxID=486041 RepID=B0DZE4_LACBS|nr:uncharacterized protein LACBIDRAFT_334513 [Laccaria bicolor S238N-H82]EDR00030.1 predicted protein [Laccaria bicolor S238N-H82]|eukprot:XP_001889339.1 predicted protein [Laccaria bicolor S238N-H82]
MAQLSGNDAPPAPTDGSSSPNSCTEIAELLSRLQLNNSQLQQLFTALTNIATTSVNEPTQQTPDKTFDLINADDVPQNVSSEGSSGKDTNAASCSPTTAAPPAIAADPTIVSPLASSNGDHDAAPDAASTVTTAPLTPMGAAVVAAPVAPALTAAPAAASTTRVFNGVTYQYPAHGTSGPFYLVTRGRDIGVFVGLENTSPLITRVSASVSFRVSSAEEGRLLQFAYGPMMRDKRSQNRGVWANTLHGISRVIKHTATSQHDFYLKRVRIFRASLCNRSTLCKTWRRQYRKKVKTNQDVPNPSEPENGPGPGEFHNEITRQGLHKVLFCSLEPKAFVEERRMHLINVTNGSPFGYVDKIVKACIRAPDGAIGLLTEAEHMWEQSLSQIRDALAEILQDYGCSEEYRTANVTANDYQNLLTLLEDVHASAVVQIPSQFEDGLLIYCLNYINVHLLTHPRIRVIVYYTVAATKLRFDCFLTLGERRRKMEMERKKLIIEPTPRAPSASDVKHALKAKQDRVLRLLRPSFASAISEGEAEEYLKKAYLVWFLRFPEVEPEIKVEEAFKDDPNYEAHIIKAREKLLRTKLGWSTFLFPSRASQLDLEEGATTQWEKELNAAIQEILEWYLPLL